MDDRMFVPAYVSTEGPTDKSLRGTRARLYPMHAWYCIGLFIFIIAVCQQISFFHFKCARRRQRFHDSDLEQAYSHRCHSFSLRRIPLGLLNAYRVIAFRWTLEIGKSYNLTMAEVLVTMIYIVFLFVWAFINTTDLEGRALDLTYWCNRSGMLAASQLPLITALGTKNNAISLITGISYDKLNYIHRMMSRVVFTLLWVHGGSEVVRNAPFQSLLEEQWLRSGITAIIALTILCAVSLRPIRVQAYELFFYVHFAMVLTFLVCAYFHAQYDAVTYWIYPCFIIWGFDRVIRVLRLVVFNFRYGSESATNGTIELLSDDFVRLKFHPSSCFHWAAGQTAYLIMPSVSRLPFEAHPFTIASIDSNLFDMSEDQESQCLKSTRIGPTPPSLSSGAPSREVVFFINVRNGFTARLKHAALKGDKVKVIIDGPYGPSPNLESYDTSVLIAGGSGVSYTLPVLLDIIEHVRNGKSHCRRVVFIWSIRSADHVQWIDKTLIRALQLTPPSLHISVCIYVTGAAATKEVFPQPDDSKGESILEDNHVCSGIVVPENRKVLENGKGSLTSMMSVKLQNGRADLEGILRDEVEMATGQVSVIVCGSQAIVRSVRGALLFPICSPLSIANGGPSVTLHVESFGYA